MSSFVGFSELDGIIRHSLGEDAANRDLTSLATIPEQLMGVAEIVCKADGIVSGIGIAKLIFAKLDHEIEQDWAFKDGSGIIAGDLVCRLQGNIRALLAAERTALNFLQHLSGIASLTRSYVDAVAGTGCRIADTRKTTPGMRHLEKHAVVHGGGVNHRLDLAGGILIKENHIAACGSLSQAVEACRKQAEVWIEVECEHLTQIEEAVTCRPDMILLDNMGVEDVRQARGMVPKRILLEASGGIDLDNARAYAETGVDRLAVGAITHSAPALDMSMRVVNLP